MTFSSNQLETQIDGLKSTFSSLDVQSKLTEATQQFQSLNTPLVGKIPGGINNGIKALDTVSADFKTPDVSGKLSVDLKHSTTMLQNLQHQLPDIHQPMSEMTPDLPGLSSKLKPSLSESSKTVASEITGTAVSESFNNLTLALPTAAALAPAIKKMSDDIQPSEITSVLESATGDLDPGLKIGLPSNLTSLIGETGINLNLSVVGSKLSLFSGGLADGLKNIIPPITGLPVLDILHKMNNSLPIINNSFNFPANINGISDIGPIVLSNLADGKLDLAAQAIKLTGIDLSEVEITAKLSLLNNQLGTASALLKSPLAGIIQTNPVSTISNISGNYSFANSLEEIQAELIHAQRSMNMVVYHWSESHEDQNVSAKDIEKSAGSVEYHYIIRKDGSIQRGKPLNEVANHVNGSINPESISVLIIGGYKSQNGEVSELTSESINSDQRNSLIGLAETIYSVFPGIQMYGHGDLDESVSSSEPGINIESMISSLYGKSNEKRPDIIRSDTGEAGGTLPIRAGVTYALGNVRNRPPQPQLINILEAAHKITGFTFKVYSAGQMYLEEWNSYPSSRTSRSGDEYFLDGKAVRKGSIRHDGGWAVDIVITTADGRELKATNNEDADVVKIVRTLLQQGINAVGAGPGYMNGNFHVDISPYAPTAYWGAQGSSKNAPRWLRGLMIETFEGIA